MVKSRNGIVYLSVKKPGKWSLPYGYRKIRSSKRRNSYMNDEKLFYLEGYVRNFTLQCDEGNGNVVFEFEPKLKDEKIKMAICELVERGRETFSRSGNYIQKQLKPFKLEFKAEAFMLARDLMLGIYFGETDSKYIVKRFEVIYD